MVDFFRVIPVQSPPQQALWAIAYELEGQALTLGEASLDQEALRERCEWLNEGYTLAYNILRCRGARGGGGGAYPKAPPVPEHG